MARTYRTIAGYDTAINTLRDYFERLQASATQWGAEPKSAGGSRRRTGKRNNPSPSHGDRS
jgi:hypothetical protein